MRLERPARPDGNGASVARLVDGLRAGGLDVPEGFRFRRTRAGSWQRSAGAWSWEISWNRAGNVGTIGSQYPVSELLRYGLDVDMDTFGRAHLYPKKV